MTVKEIIEIENTNTGNINLFKEGIFWRAYNQSAMLLVNNLKSFKINRKHVKKVKQDIFYCGFPNGLLDDITNKAVKKGYDVVQNNDKQIIIKNVVKNNDDYETWKEQYNTRSRSDELMAKESETLYAKTKKSATELLIKQIREYPLENSTPMEAMQFVQQLKKLIKNDASI